MSSHRARLLGPAGSGRLESLSDFETGTGIVGRGGTTTDATSGGGIVGGSTEAVGAYAWASAFDVLPSTMARPRASSKESGASSSLGRSLKNPQVVESTTVIESEVSARRSHLPPPRAPDITLRAGGSDAIELILLEPGAYAFEFDAGVRTLSDPRMFCLPCSFLAATKSARRVHVELRLEASDWGRTSAESGDSVAVPEALVSHDVVFDVMPNSSGTRAIVSFNVPGAPTAIPTGVGGTAALSPADPAADSVPSPTVVSAAKMVLRISRPRASWTSWFVDDEIAIRIALKRYPDDGEKEIHRKGQLGALIRTLASAALSTSASPLRPEGSSEDTDDDKQQPRSAVSTLRTTPDGRFVDVHDRDCLLRGVNLSANAKLPVGWATQATPDGEPSKPSFVGRPFPLDQSRDHLERLSRFGFNALRFCFTWEAVAHAGPYDFDVDYLNYIERVVRDACAAGFVVFMDAHQDVWSRPTGGSGAPAWTLELAGLDRNKLVECEACFTHHSASPQANPTKFSRMTWPQNYQRFACLHMFTLFFAGRDLDPNAMVKRGWTPGALQCEASSPTDPDAVHIQDFLQDAFLAMWVAVMSRFKDEPRVIGVDLFNEPSAGLVGKDVERVPEVVIPPGLVLSPAETWAVSAAGVRCRVKRANALGLLRSHLIGGTGVTVWLPGRTDWWARGGGFTVNAESAQNPGLPSCRRRAEFRSLDFFRDRLFPFLHRAHLHLEAEIGRPLLCFAEGDAFAHKAFVWDRNATRSVVNATHWYDGATLFFRRFDSRVTLDTARARLVCGRESVRALHERDLRAIKAAPRDASSGAAIALPTLVGEFGVPFDLNGRHGLRTGDFAAHERALGMYYSVMDTLDLSSTLWNYTPDNSNQFGDNWNLEDLSVYSPDQANDSAAVATLRRSFSTRIDDTEFNGFVGARALRGFCRPWAPRVCGRRRLARFDPDEGVFVLRYLPDLANFRVDDETAATEIWLPVVHFGHFVVTASGGASFRVRRDDGRHVLFVWAVQVARVVQRVEVVISRRSELAMTSESEL